MDSPDLSKEPQWLIDWRHFCANYRRDRGLSPPPLTHEQRETAWRVFCDRLEQERLRRLFSPHQRDSHARIEKLPLFPPKDGQ